MQNTHEQPGSKSRELVRLETFSDGVFAIAITLLILEVIQALHNGNPGELRQLLMSNWKSIMVFLVGFLTILICWINHHLVLSHADKTDYNFFWVNGFVLLVVTFTPFPTAILAEYLEKESQLALAVFGFNYFMMSLAAYCMTAYVYRHLIPKEKRSVLLPYKRLYKYSVIYTFAVVFICFISVPVAIFFYLVLFIVFASPRHFASKLPRRGRKKRHLTSSVNAD